MAPEVTIEDYRSCYGEIDPGDFAGALPVAVAEVRELTGGKEPRGELQEGAWKRAVCSAIRADRAYGFSHGTGEGLGSFTLGKFSASLGDAAQGPSAWSRDVRSAARRELVGTGLLYAGLA